MISINERFLGSMENVVLVMMVTWDSQLPFKRAYLFSVK